MRTSIRLLLSSPRASGTGSSTVRDYRSLWALYVAGTLGNKSVTDITAEDIRKIHTKTAAAVVARIKSKCKGRAAIARADQAASEGATAVSRLQVPMASDGWKGHRTANKVIALLRAVLSFAGRRKDNPAIEVSLFKQARRRRRLSDEEALAFRRALEAFEELWREFFLLSLLTGMRRQLLVAMRWADVDLDRARWIVPATWSKHGDEIVIPLTREAVTVLSEMKNRRGASAWVFPSEKIKVRPYRRAEESAGEAAESGGYRKPLAP